MLKKIYISIVLFITLGLVLGLVLYIKKPNIHQSHHQGYIAAQAAVDQHYARLQAEILNKRLGNVLNYDLVQHHFLELERHASALKIPPGFLSEQSQQELIAKAEMLNGKVSEMEWAVSDFQRANSLLRNSVNFFLSEMEQIKSLTNSLELVGIMDEMERMVYIHLLSDKRDPAVLRDLLQQVVNHPLRPLEVAPLRVHVETIISQVHQTEVAFKKVASFKLEKDISVIHSHYQYEYDIATAEYEGVLLIGTVSTLLFVIALMLFFIYMFKSQDKRLHKTFGEAVSNWGRGRFSYRMALTKDDTDRLVKPLNTVF